MLLDGRLSQAVGLSPLQRLVSTQDETHVGQEWVAQRTWRWEHGGRS